MQTDIHCTLTVQMYTYIHMHHTLTVCLYSYSLIPKVLVVASDYTTKRRGRSGDYMYANA